MSVILKDNHDSGDLEARLLSKQELAEMEPELSESALGAVFCPREMVTEPWLIPIAYAQSAKLNGAQLLVDSEVTNTIFDENGKYWTISLKNKAEIKSKFIINCAGLYGDHIEALHNSDKKFEI